MKQKAYQDMVRGQAPVQHPVSVNVCQWLQHCLGMLDQGQQAGPLVGELAVLAPSLQPVINQHQYQQNKIHRVVHTL